MINKTSAFILFLFFCCNFSFAQDNTLIKADKQFISLDFTDAAELYEKFLAKNSKDFYASRQAALCYGKINNPAKAIDHWTNVYENGQANDKDRLEYAKCLLANYRADEAKKVFTSLDKSTEPGVAAWSKAFFNVGSFYEDSALCKVFELKGINSKKAEFGPMYYISQGELVYISGSGEKVSNFYSAQREDSVTFKKAKKFNKQIQHKYINGPLCITPDDSVMYFTRSAAKKDMKRAGKKNVARKLLIFQTDMNGYGLAHTEIHPFIHNSLDYDCMHPFVDKSGKKLYFSSDMPGTLGGKDIFMCEWKDGAWDKPKNLGPHINSPGNETYPIMNNEGVLFFTSDYRPGLGGMDIFFADPSHDGDMFLEAENIGSTINTQFNDYGIHILKDGKRGYFSSNRKTNTADADIYYFLNNKPRSFPVKIRFIDSVSNAGISSSFTINSTREIIEQKLDSGQFFTTRLKQAHDVNISASAPGSKNKIFIKNLSYDDTILTIVMSPKSLKCIEGKVFDKDNNAPLTGMKVAIYDEEGNNYLDILTDSTGVYKMCNLPLGKALYIGSQKKPDYFTNTEKFVIKKDSDLLKDIFAQKIVIGKAIKVDNIYFDKGKFNVRADAALELDKLVRLMKDNPLIIIELSSHTDCIGNATANLTLSDKRAKSSAAYIISKGIAKMRIKGKGYGESKLLNNCKCEGKVQSQCAEEEHAVNRRAEFKVTGFVAESAKTDISKGKKK